MSFGCDTLEQCKNDTPLFSIPLSWTMIKQNSMKFIFKGGFVFLFKSPLLQNTQPLFEHQHTFAVLECSYDDIENWFETLKINVLYVEL